MLKISLKDVCVILVLICVILASVVSHDEYHLNSCKEDNCPICFIIHVAQTIMSVIFIACLYEIFTFIIVSIKIIKIQEKTSTYSNTLVMQKIQFNE